MEGRGADRLALGSTRGEGPSSHHLLVVVSRPRATPASNSTCSAGPRRAAAVRLLQSGCSPRGCGPLAQGPMPGAGWRGCRRGSAPWLSWPSVVW